MDFWKEVHIDDDVSVLQNGKLYGFKVCLIGSQDDDWTKKILDIVHNMNKSGRQVVVKNSLSF